MGRPKGSKNKPKKPVVKITIQDNMERESGEGIYTSPSEESYKSKEQVRVEKMYKGNVSVNYPDRYIAELTFDELHEEIQRRAELRQKVENREYSTTIEIQTDHPIAIGWLADTHVVGQDVDYARLRWEIEEVKNNPYMKLFTGGDLTDGFCWNPAQFGDVGNINEQSLYLHRMFEYLGADKVLAGVMGSHEKWARRTGLDSYVDIRKNIPIFDGIGVVNLLLNDVAYRGAIAHELKGSSYINPNHQQKRFVMENGKFDFVCSAHTHNGAEQSQNIGNEKVVFLSGKAFKRADDFLDTKGFSRKDGDSLGINWMYFNHKRKMIIPLSSTAEVLEIMGSI